jgi:hypothetical protein
VTHYPIRILRVAAVLFVALLVVVACEPTLEQATGIVTSVDTPAFGRVDAFELRTRDGETLRFDTTELEFRAEFAAPHLSEHQRLSDAIAVTFRCDGGRLIVTRLTDID